MQTTSFAREPSSRSRRAWAALVLTLTVAGMALLSVLGGVQDASAATRTLGHTEIFEVPTEGEWSLVTFASPDRQVHGTVLRPDAWIRAQGVRPGGVHHFEAEGLNLDQEVQVERIEPLTERVRVPVVHTRYGPRHVTGWISRPASRVIDLGVQVNPGDAPEMISATSKHPFFSNDRQRFVAAEDLTVGERVSLVRGGSASVTSSRPRDGPQNVYNIEVQGEAEYAVGSLGVVVHNTYAKVGKDGRVSAPSGGGVYIVRSADGKTAYVGKAAEFSDRLGKHGRKGNLNPGDEVEFIQDLKGMTPVEFEQMKINEMVEQGKKIRNRTSAHAASATDAAKAAAADKSTPAFRHR